MKKWQSYSLFLILTILAVILFSCKESQLDTKLIVSKYSEGVVKILLLDPKLEKVKEGSGYVSRGSGFFVTKDGYIFTNRHVVEMCVRGYVKYTFKGNDGKFWIEPKTYSEQLIDNKVRDKNFLKFNTAGYTIPIIQVYHGKNENDYTLYIAEVVAIGMGAFDGAILKVISDIDGKPVKEKFTALPIGNSDKAEQGEQLCVFGFPAQFVGQKGREYLDMLLDMSTLSTGIMSGLDFVFNKDYGYIKTDAEIHGGNSGGPVFNENNEVVGIATATGTKTHIGLVGGINGMYFISASNIKLQKKLMSLGLKSPVRSFSINTTSGEKLPMKTVAQINAEVNSRKGLISKPKPKPKSTYSTNYKNAKVYFSNISPKENNNFLPGKTKRYEVFNLTRTKPRIYVYLDNSMFPLNTSQIYWSVYKVKNGKYKYFKKKYLDIKPTYNNAHFSIDIFEAGKFRFTAYTKEYKYIRSGYVTTQYK